MRKITSLVMILLLSCSLLFLPLTLTAQAARTNNYSVVLVHGFAGWGKGELLGYNYWGGLGNIEADLTRQGYTTYTAAVGPFSSNWDRACELYAYIKGGKVDYGVAHAAKFGHSRFGRTFPGLINNWGEGDNRKVHLIGHSMGGQTIRTLVQLLEAGSAEEMAATQSSELSPLFTGGKSWVRSVTTVSTPNDGTTMANAINGAIPFAQQLIGMASSAAGLTNQQIYDFKLDQWGLKRASGESYASYSNRVWNSPIWTNSKDISAWDLSPNGARELNTWVKASPNVYYFSIGTEATHQELFGSHQIANITMNAFLWPFAAHMGAYTSNQPGSVLVNSSWWKNDGVVNLNSMDAPQVGSTDQVKPYSSIVQPGIWYYVRTAVNTDHMQIVGHYNILPFYYYFRDQANILGTLPQ
ncbi:MAG: esterase/lipase family protein [Methylocystaceae bacterium]